MQSLPSIEAKPTPKPVELKATGTDDLAGQQLCQQSGDFDGHLASSSVTNESEIAGSLSILGSDITAAKNNGSGAVGRILSSSDLSNSPNTDTIGNSRAIGAVG